MTPTKRPQQCEPAEFEHIDFVQILRIVFVSKLASGKELREAIDDNGIEEFWNLATSGETF